MSSSPRDCPMLPQLSGVFYNRHYNLFNSISPLLIDEVLALPWPPSPPGSMLCKWRHDLNTASHPTYGRMRPPQGAGTSYGFYNMTGYLQLLFSNTATSSTVRSAPIAAPMKINITSYFNAHGLGEFGDWPNGTVHHICIHLGNYGNSHSCSTTIPE